MVKEGIGLVIPHPVKVQITRDDLRILRLHAQEQDAAKSHFRKSSQWGRGLHGALSEQQAKVVGGPLSPGAVPILLGSVGEWAADIYLKSRGAKGIDSKIRKFGDGGVDIKLRGLTHQVKTKRRVNGLNLYRCEEVKAAVIVFAQWDFGEYARLLGCISRENLKTMKTQNGIGGWSNWVVPDEELLPMCRVLAELDSRCP